VSTAFHPVGVGIDAAAVPRFTLLMRISRMPSVVTVVGRLTVRLVVDAGPPTAVGVPAVIVTGYAAAARTLGRTRPR
jgi:hypothetical protein